MFFCLKTDHGFVCFFFFNDTATTEIYTLSLHDALPIAIPKAGADHSRSGRESRVRLSCGDRSPGFRLQYLQTEARYFQPARLGDALGSQTGRSQEVNVGYARSALRQVHYRERDSSDRQ